MYEPLVLTATKKGFLIIYHWLIFVYIRCAQRFKKITDKSLINVKNSSKT